MEACLDILKTSRSESQASRELKNFCDEHSTTFMFQQTDVSLRRNFIDVILKELATRSHEEEFVVNSLSALRILSRDKNGLGLLTSENSCKTLFALAGLRIDPEKKEKTDGAVAVEEKESDDNATCKCANVESGGVGIMDYETAVQTSAIIIEALKCLCNIIYHSKVAREHCMKYRITEAVLSRVQNWFEKDGIPVDLLCFDVRLLFLLTAFEDSERTLGFELKGVCILTHVLDQCVPGKAERDRTHSTAGKDGCGEVEFEKLNKMTANERFKMEKNPKAFEMTPEEIHLASEILKVMFNVTMALPTEFDHHTLEHYERIILICCSLFVHVRELPAGADNVHNHAVNILNSIPKQAIQYLYWAVPKSVMKAFVADFETNRKKMQYRTFYQNYNMASIHFLLSRLNNKLDTQDIDTLVPIVSALCYLSKGNRIIRKYLRLEILPALTNVTHTRPEEGNSIKNKLVKLMTTPSGDIRDMAAELLFVLCKEDADRLIKHTGYGNAAGLLARRGLMGGGHDHEGDYSSDDNDSDTEEYTQVKHQIDPILGAIPQNNPNPLDSMTEEEKEEEAEKLAELIESLNKLGVIQTVQIGPDGMPLEHKSLRGEGQGGE